MGSTNTWSVSGSVAGAAFYFRCCSSFDNKESPSNIRGRLGCKGSNGRRIEVVKRDEEREREWLLEKGVKRGGICGGNHHLTDPTLAHFAFMHVASRAVEGLNVREKCQFSRGARRVLLRRTWMAGNRRSDSLIGVG